MSNTTKRPFQLRYPSRQGGSKTRHFRLDNETVRQLDEAIAWYETRGFSYTDSSIARLAIRDLMTHLRASDPEEEEEILGRLEVARAGRA